MQQFNKKSKALILTVLLVITVLAVVIPFAVNNNAGNVTEPPQVAELGAESYTTSVSGGALPMKTVYSGVNLYDINSPFNAYHLPTSSVEYNTVNSSVLSVNFGSSAEQRQRGQSVDTSLNTDYRLSFGILSEHTDFGLSVRAKNNSSSWATTVIKKIYEDGLTERNIAIEFNSGSNTNLALFFYLVNNATQESVELTDILVERVAVLPDDPVKEGHDFIGWFLDEDCTIPYDFREITDDLVLYAGFQIHTFTIDFNSLGGSSVSPITVDWNTFPSLPVSVRDGYTFKGWYLDETCLTPYNGTAITENKSFYAKWQKDYFAVTFNENGGESVSDIEVAYLELPTLPELTRVGYNFLGWYTTEDTLYVPAQVTDNISLTAKWEIKRYTVTFIVDGNEYATLEVDHGTSLDELKVKNELTGYSLVSLDGQILAADSKVTEDSILTAVKDAEKTTEFFFTDVWAYLQTNSVWFIVSAVVLVALVIIGAVFGIKRSGR